LPKISFRPARVVATALACALAACAGPRPDAAFYGIDGEVAARTGQTVRWQRGVTADSTPIPPALLAGPLDADGAIALALARNPALQIELAELAIADADLAQASTLRNPRFGFTRLANGAGVEIDRSVMIDLVSLLTFGLRRDIEARRFDRSRLVAADAAVRLAIDTRRAWIEAVAARQTLLYARQAVEAAEASAELGRRMVAAGNWPRLSQLREEAFMADTRTRLQRAELTATATRERLARLIGLADVSGGAGGNANATPSAAQGQPAADADLLPHLPDRLPPLPAAALDLPGAEQSALDHRLDVQAARFDADVTARDLGLTRATRWINVAEVGYVNQSKPGEARQNGYEISVELPLFDQGDSRLARAEAVYWQRVQNVARVVVDARSQVREAHARYRGGWQLAARYRDELLPLRRQISDEQMLRYNAMFADVFALLIDAREQIDAVMGAIDAERDFWLAEADLQAALGQPLPTATAPAAAPTSSLTPNHAH